MTDIQERDWLYLFKAALHVYLRLHHILVSENIVAWQWNNPVLCHCVVQTGVYAAAGFEEEIRCMHQVTRHSDGAQTPPTQLWCRNASNLNSQAGWPDPVIFTLHLPGSMKRWSCLSRNISMSVSMVTVLGWRCWTWSGSFYPQLSFL